VAELFFSVFVGGEKMYASAQGRQEVRGPSPAFALVTNKKQIRQDTSKALKKKISILMNFRLVVVL